MQIILASGSPRRRELLEQAGYSFAVEVSDADENIEADSPAELVEELSFRKAMAAAGNHAQKSVCAAGTDASSLSDDRKEKSIDGKWEEMTIIGADTIVALDRKILGKPDGEDGAVRMLRKLSGKIHQVYTGVSLLLLRQGVVAAAKKFHVCTDVSMREITDDEITAYVATGEPMDKAGAYGIQGKAAVFISGICGDYYNVVGLPLCRLHQELERMWEENGVQKGETEV